MTPLSLADYDLPALEAAFAAAGHKPAQAGRLLLDFYKHAGHVDLTQLRLGKPLLDWLRQNIALRGSRVLARETSADGTIKLLLGLQRGGAVETVLMPTPKSERAAGCLSSQLGCPLGCLFCATAHGGFERNLESGEIVEQFLHLREQAAATARRLATIVFMGMGEPLLNFENVVAAIKRIAGSRLGDIGGRNIMVSTAGIVPGILQLAAANLHVTLALSLHAPDDETRARLVPLTARYGVREIIAAAKRYHEITGTITNIAYCLLDGVNDSADHARALVELLRGFRTHVNLIPYNPPFPLPLREGVGGGGVLPPHPALRATLSREGRGFAPPPVPRQREFLGILRAAGIVAHLREPRGQDIAAACGQLRAKRQNCD